jgi:membrane-associated phospholipid phosphatase
MTQLQASAAWRLFSYNWIPIGLMAVALALGLALTGFSIKPQSVLVPFGAVGLYAGVAYYNANTAHKRDPLVVFVLGSMAQLVSITLLMTPLTYIAASANLPMMDASLDHLDRALGLDWQAYFSFIYERPWLIPAVVLSYGMIGVPVFGIPVVLGAARHYRRLQVFTLAFALALIVTTIISVFVPAIGTYDQLGIKPDPSIFTPGAYLEQLRDLPLVRDGSLRQLDIVKVAGIITFPSFHAAAAVLYLWALWSVRWLRPFTLAVNAAMLLATPIGGGHYFVDVFAGMAVAVLAIAAALRISECLTAPIADQLLAAPSAAE